MCAIIHVEREHERASVVALRRYWWEGTGDDSEQRSEPADTSGPRVVSYTTALAEVIANNVRHFMGKV